MGAHSFFSSETLVSENEEVRHGILEKASVSLFLKREDKIHHEVSGNKFRKLKYNLINALQSGQKTVLTFGGAFSNHIAATAAAGKIIGLKTIGIIRGDELEKNLSQTLQENDTLRYAVECGMQLKFVSRENYRLKTTTGFLATLQEEFGQFYHIPEGGTNEEAILGCKEILKPSDTEFDTICCAVGTGGTISGIINSSHKHQKIIGFPALRGDFLTDEIKKHTNKTNWTLENQYHFGGYGKINATLIEFINTFKQEQGISLDPVYTGKMIYGIFDMATHGVFKKNTRILAIHTGGLQGVSGMNKKLFKKGFTLIKM